MLLELPVRVKQAVGLARVEPIATARPVLPESVLLAIVAARVVYCSMSKPEEALEDKFSQLLMILSEISNVNAVMPVEA